MTNACDALELGSNCLAEGWDSFLQLTCRYCELAATCAPAQELLASVKQLWKRLQDCSLTCWSGLQALATVHKQFSSAGLIHEGHALPECLPPWVSVREHKAMSQLERERIRFWRPLFPFPLLASQQLLYTHLDAAGPLSLCSMPDARMYISRRFVPRAHHTESYCAIRRTDLQLLKACRSRRNQGGDLFQHALLPVQANQLRLSRPSAAAWSQTTEELGRSDRRLAGGKCLHYVNESCVSPGSVGFELRRPFLPPCQSRNADLSQRREHFFAVQCPEVLNASAWWGWEDETSWPDEGGMKKYRTRSSDGGCQSQTGAWGTNMQDALKCVLVVIAEKFDFRPGELLLDWGSGCGFTMSWAKAYYDVDAIGIDVTASAAWAAKYSIGLSCMADGRNLHWLPDELFDYVFSYAALLHLSFEEQCEVAHQLVQKLRRGGRAFLGWNRANLVGPWQWHDCFRPTEDASHVELETLEEANLFVEDASKAVGSFAWDFPTYAVLLRRVS